jgi:ribosomal protein S12 methylthiotransferase
MGRGYTGEHCRWLVRRLREAIPHVALRTSIIVGFPGETDADHRSVLNFLEETRFDRLVAFPYFPEKGTSAFLLDGRVDDVVQKTRLEKLLKLQAGISREKNRSFAGQTLDVLVDDPGSDSAPARGRSYREAPEVDGVIRFPGLGLRAGQFIRVRITAGQTFDLTGVPIRGEASTCVP